MRTAAFIGKYIIVLLIVNLLPATAMMFFPDNPENGTMPTKTDKFIQFYILSLVLTTLPVVSGATIFNRSGWSNPRLFILFASILGALIGLFLLTRTSGELDRPGALTNFAIVSLVWGCIVGAMAFCSWLLMKCNFRWIFSRT